MAESKDIKIEVVIAERNYHLSVTDSDEKKVRDAVARIGDKFDSYKKNNRYRDYQDLLAMICLQLATQNVKLESDDTYRNQDLRKHLDDINVLLSENVD